MSPKDEAVWRAVDGLMHRSKRTPRLARSVTRSLTHSFAHSRPEWFAFLRPSTIAITGLKDATLNCSSKEERREKRDERDKHDRDDRDEGGNGPVPEMTRSERSEKCAKRLNNEQLNCN